ncbi:hypothetical protein N864_08765 [Intrasporangium chromatireducens Q5-1]|uniref:DUF3710 domain-containing protein n=1 Tax=Intrasporangium chromatireducens Q5-1 TaxID=584657 RepID=W9GR07_9MICO|nr:DUF3710 domain-containing protein [Intrasporangium chromatireducens]EWT07268.1 hypothetical protein N864_08765 [Intrasporangium chromatireducens Q5-1]
MGLFKRDKSADVRQDDALAPEEATDPALESRDPSEPATARGPWDRGEVADESEYLNLGSIWLKGVPGMELRLEVNEQEQQITGVTAVLGESAVQLQAFAAPRTEGVWIEIRNEIAATITDSGGTAEVVTGEFGEELQTRMPQAGPDGRTMFVPARFIGVDGPRWFLRAVVSGRAAIEPAAAEPIHEVVRTVVIDRGGEAMAPRELLPLRLPDTATTDVPEEQAGAARMEDLNPFERGPEITEVR